MCGLHSSSNLYGDISWKWPYTMGSWRGLLLAKLGTSMERLWGVLVRPGWVALQAFHKVISTGILRAPLDQGNHPGAGQK